MSGTEGRLPAAPERDSRIVYLDFLRVAAAFFVIVNHTNSRIFQGSEPSPGWYASLAYFFVSKFAVPVFLMISGTLFLRRPPDWERWPRRILRAVVLLVAANLLYYGFDLLTDPETELSFEAAVTAVFSGKGRFTLWYLHLYLALTILMPFFQKLAGALGQKEERTFILLTVLLNGGLSMLRIFWPALKLHSIYYTASVSVYIGLLFAGHYCDAYVEVGRRKALLAGAVFLGILGLELGLTRLFYARNPASYLPLDERTFPTVTVQAWCVFLLAKYLFRDPARRPRLGRALGTLGRLTLGIFLLSELGIHYLEPVYLGLAEHLPRLAAMLIWELAIFAAAGLVTALLRTIPLFRKYL